jgi:NTE family protein
MFSRSFLISLAAAAILSACASNKPSPVSGSGLGMGGASTQGNNAAGMGNTGNPNNPTSTAPATVAPPPPPPGRAMRIGLALGGGAARGFAHVGVIKALEAAGVPVDVVTGTSAGSMVAVLYASGMNAAQLQQASSNMDEATLADWTLSLRGVIKGQALQDYVNGQVKNRTLDAMNKPVGVVATDFQSGEAVTFTRGNSGMAVRASASIPGVFSPTVINARTYVDGGLASPVPAKAAKAMGADFIIAVDISARPGKPPEGLAATLNQTVAIMGQNLRNEELKAYADIVIHPNLDHVSGTDFKSRTISISEGEASTVAVMAQIKQQMAAAKKRLNLN